MDKKICFEFAPDAYEELTSLQRRLSTRNKAEVVRYGLRTLLWILDEIDAHSHILVENNEKVEEVEFPFLKEYAESKNAA
jgi:hypothetical protein